MEKRGAKSERGTLVESEKEMNLVGERVMAAAEKIAQAVSGRIDLAKLSSDRAYGLELQSGVLEPIVIRYAKKEKLIVQACFEILPEMTPMLGPDDEVIGVALTDMQKKGRFQRCALNRVKDFFPENQFMRWFYDPIWRGQGVWSNVYFDHYIHINVITYSLPIYVQGKLVGVLALDLDYNDFSRTLNKWLIENIESKIAFVKKEHEILGQGDRFSSQYISLETLELIGRDHDGFVTHSKAMERVMQMAAKAAISTANILILGETGVGKDFIASCIHSMSPVKNGPFVNVNCSAIPESLLESEFFGYERGAFTGASREGKPGYFEMADGGTIFLNEIGELPYHLQAKFLNVIQQKQVVRVGGTTPKKVEFRLIAATNRNLFALVEQGKFREDLYYRLSVIPIHIPPLRERKEDIVSLLTYFLHKNAEKYGVRRIFTPEAVNVLVNYPWPGNVRELENLVERLVVTSEGTTIDVDALPPELMTKKIKVSTDANRKKPAFTSLKDRMKDYEAQIIREAYEELGSSRKVAKALRISQAQACRKIREYVKGFVE